MARDNGSRGFYRHSDTTESTAQKQQLSTSEKANEPASDKEPTHKAMKTIKDLQYIDGPNPNHLSDHASDLLNARFPPMPVPGSIPRRQTEFCRSFGRQRPAYGWKDVTIATAFYGSAAVGFSVIMWDGLQAIGGLLVEAGDRLLHESLLRLGL